jgi:hypothetical protein
MGKEYIKGAKLMTFVCVINVFGTSKITESDRAYAIFAQKIIRLCFFITNGHYAHFVLTD